MEEERTRQKYDFFISYAHKDVAFARELSRTLNEFGYHSWLDNGNLMAGADWQKSIINSIREAKAVILIITENYVKSESCKSELLAAINGAKDTGRMIIPFCHENCKSAINDFFLMGYHFVLFNENNFLDKIPAVFEIYENRYKSDALYERLNQFIDIDSSNYIIETIEKLLPFLPKEISFNEELINFPYYYELFLLLKQIDEHAPLIDEDKITASSLKKILSYLNRLYKFSPNLKSDQSYLINLALIINIQKAKKSIHEALSKAGCFEHEGDLEEETDFYISIFKALLNKYDLEKERDDRVIEIIKSANNYIEELSRIQSIQSEFEDMGFENEPKPGEVPPICSSIVEDEDSDNNEGLNFEAFDKLFEDFDNQATLENNLFEIARCIEKSNSIFEVVGDKNETYQFLKCLKTSYERLKNFCEVIKCGKVMAYCIERISEVDSKLNRLLDNKNEKEELKESSFKALLGFSLATDKDFDVFLSYRHHDEDIATNVYSFLKKNLIKVFMDKMTLPELGKSEYRKATEDAVCTSKHFILLVTKLEDLEDENGWMYQEYNLYLDERAEGLKPNGNLVMIFTDSLYDEEVAKNKKKNLPHSLRSRFEILKVSNYQSSILGYLKNTKL